MEAPRVRRAPLPGKGRFESHRNALICALALAGSVLLTDPIANLPFSDAFSYDKTALEFAQTGHFLYNGWATAMLGWLIPWGAVFIKLFGFSFNVMRMSMLPLDMATVYLFHQILRRFGIGAGSAVFGTLALALSPIFLPSAASYMTDVPGLLVTFGCIYMCQRAVTASSDRATLIWLCSATAVNLAGGTVRQIAWLGALIMVPSTAWLLRERRGMKIAGVLLWVVSLASVLLCLHWFNSQPYSVPEHLIWAPVRFMMLLHLVAQLIKAFACLLLVILPVSIAWLPSARSLDRKYRLRIAAAVVLLLALWSVAYAAGRIDTWLMPWLLFLLPEQSGLVPGMFGTPAAMVVWIRLAISLAVFVPALIVAAQLASRKQPATAIPDRSSMPWKDMAWILLPFCVSYILLLTPRGAFDQIQDRYLIGLTPFAIIFLLRLYQERIQPTLPPIGVITLAIYAVYSVAGTHDFFAESRAQVRGLQMVQDSGVPRTLIQAGFPSDGWVQIQNGGHINEPRLRFPAGAYKRDDFNPIPEKCRNGFTGFAPIITPRYFVFFPWFKNPPDPPAPWCFVPTAYPDVHYTTWLPPFHGTLHVEQLRYRSK
jgi:hypothetical protein